MSIGPIQMVVLGFGADAEFDGAAFAELEKLRDHDVIRVVDLMAVRKDQAGEVEALELSNLTADQATEFGAYVGALIGFGADGEEGGAVGALAGAEALEDGHVFDQNQVWFVADAIPNGTTAVVALL